MDENAPDYSTGEFWAHLAVSTVSGAISGGLAASGVGLPGQVIWNSIIGAASAIADTAIDDDGTTTTQTYVLNGIVGGVVGALSGLVGGKGTASKHVTNSFKRVLNNGNWSYYFTQIGKEATKDGIKAIPSILRSYIPSIIKNCIGW